MIKSIVSFIKNLFGSKEPQQPEQQAPAAWPFPTSVPEDGPVQKPVDVIADQPVSETYTVTAATSTAPKKRKRRAPKKTTTVAPATKAAAVKAPPAQPAKEEVKLSPGPSRRRKAKK